MQHGRIPAALLAATAFGVSAAPADAALSRAQQAAKAEGQASFQCFVHDCKSRKAIAVAPVKGGAMLYRYRYLGMHHVHGHPYYARCDQLLKVTAQGGVVQHRIYNCA